MKMTTMDEVLNKIEAKNEPANRVEFKDYTFERFADFCMSAGVNAQKEIITEYLAAKYWAGATDLGDEITYQERRLDRIEDELNAISARDMRITDLVYGSIHNGLDERLDNPNPKAALFKGKAGFAVQFTGFDKRMYDVYIEQFSSDPIERVYVERIDKDGIVLYSVDS